MSRIAILDYGMGNFHSVARALRCAAPKAEVSLCRTPEALAAAERVVLPGQGAMADCMRVLNQSGLREALLAALASKPVLGICVGEQMLFDRSEEDNTPCLGLWPGDVRRFAGPAFAPELNTAPLLKVPHMGWNRVQQCRAHPLWAGIADSTHFYFVHSYYAVPEQAELTVGLTEYGAPFSCAVAADNIFAVQFHPEKSAAPGLHLLRNFASWYP